jgi:hypothetical protein
MKATQDPPAAVFWGIIFGTHGKTGQRIVPSYRARKRLREKCGLDRSLAEWREWAAMPRKEKRA